MGRIGSGLMTIFLSLATFVQLNDPDALLWMMIYGLPCLLTFAAFVNKNIIESQYWWTACVAVFAGVLGLFLLQTSITFRLDNILRWNLISIEEGRELIGIGIVFIWLVFLSHKSSSVVFHTIVLLFAASILGLWVVYKELIQPRIEVPEHCSNLL